MIALVPGSSRARRMLAIAFLAQSCTTGLTYGSFGAIIPVIEETFQTTRALSSMGPGLIGLALGLLAPLIGLLLRHVSIRLVLAAGAATNAIAYFSLTLVGDIGQFLAVVALLVGSGNALLSIFAPAALVSHWYRERRGFALALMNFPIFLILMPPIAAAVVKAYGMTTWFWIASGMFALLIPIMLMVVDTPAQIGEQPYGAAPAADQAPEPPTVRIPALLANPQFWLLTLGVGLASGAANAFLTHAVPFARSTGVSLTSGAVLITAFGTAGLFGNLFFGWLADRIGASATLMISSLGQAALWIGLLLAAGNLLLLIGAAALFGIFCASINALHGAVVNELFGSRNVGSVLGFGYLFKLPFIFGCPLMAGFLFDLRGNYALPFASLSVGLLGVAACFAVLASWRALMRLAARRDAESAQLGRG